MAGEDVYIIGAAMHPFGRFPDKSTMEMTTEIILAALADAQMSMKDMQVFGCGSQYEMGAGQRIITNLGVFDVVDACYTAKLPGRVEDVFLANAFLGHRSFVEILPIDDKQRLTIHDVFDGRKVFFDV